MISRAVVPSSIVFEVLDKDKDNYVDWSEVLEAYLKARDLWDVVISDQQPQKKEKELKAWEKKNAAALHAIKISCGTNTLSHIRGIREAFKAWVRLEQRFSNQPSFSNNRQNFLRVKDSFWIDDHAEMTATVITKSFEAENLDFALKLLKSCPEQFILARDIDGNSPLCAAARAPRLFRRTYHHPFLPKYICEVLGPRLPLGWIDFEISGMDFLSLLGNAISDSSTHSKKKIDIISEALFEAIKHENFNFILMLINFLRPIVNFTNDEGRNLYMIAIAHRSAKLFSLYFWNNRDEADSDPSRSFDKWHNNLLHMVGALTSRIAFNRISKPALLMKRELMWFKEVEKLVPERARKSKNCDGKTPHELFNESHKDLIMEAEKWMKKSASSWAVVGPLIITVMFAAAFQVPGGSLQDKGYPVFLGKWLFKVYMALVAISLFSATISVLKFLEANYEEEDFHASLRTYDVITGTLFLSLATMLVAFCMGLFLTLHGDLAIFLPIAAITTFLVGYIIFTKLPLLAESLNFFTFEEVKIPFIKWRTSIFDRNIDHEVDLIFKMLNREPTKEVNTRGNKLCCNLLYTLFM